MSFKLPHTSSLIVCFFYRTFLLLIKHKGWIIMVMMVFISLQRCLASKWCKRKPLYQIKDYRAGFQTIPRILEIRWIIEFFKTSKCEHPNHLLKATSRKRVYFSPIYFFLHLRTKSARNSNKKVACYTNKLHPQMPSTGFSYNV